ncbi:hypothetical protein QBC44DRAFT_99846 [Cladorrhinum sp. PSN332]|nr:hypothetical protein QBC44DRAFT_99846 [Cladorrhinum sp. PSN332]
MYGRFLHGTQDRPSTASEEEDSRNEGRAPRQDETGSDLHPSSPPSTAMSTDSPSPSHSGPAAGRSSPGRSTVDRLVKKLSKHNLELGSRSRGQSQPPPPPLPQLQPQSQPPTHHPQAPWPKTEIDTRPGQLASTGPFGRISPYGPPPMLDAGEPIEVDDEEETEPLDIKRLNFRRTMRRQPSGMGMRQKAGGSSGSSSRSAESRLERMIANEMQCKVRRDPLSATRAPTPSSSQSTTIIAAEPNSIEVDPDFSMPNWDGALEVDPSYMNGNSEPTEDETSLLEESRLALRDASGPSGIRKYSAGGLQLKYRLSVDAALRCQNVVRSRPRMRKRDKSRFPSAASSAVGSAVSSPVITPTYPPS